ncbi:DHA2 family efflux MFS transporter permease subunit [Agrobacterium tumefaciens]|uniref:DHA2 family efflux MFS transporter permease subunit n=1 Tax=Agrobacterium tumefaciens TaxID=358 RepID=UPI00287CCBF2|nr:DHA2 family efflux MFS transporter permease subunit [Agrobacterium tumefaciens]MDS7593929.1 DHA2 family efflux MFS transporter permease subunit [Agrobacterium tumefaciens]
MGSAGETMGNPETTQAAPSPWLVAIVVALAAFMEVLDTTIANVALRYISGGLGISADESSWVVTTYLVSNAVALIASSFIARRYGRKRVYLTCLVTFTIASVFCGIAWDLQSLLIFRVIQGFAGGGMVPVSQSILTDSFPREKRGQAFAVFGIAVVVAPVIGPTLGGYLSDNLSWHWCFLINGPVGVFASLLVYMLIQDRPSAKLESARMKAEGVNFDLVGFLLIATFLGSLELVLDRGQTDDWLDSSFIVMTAVICVTALAASIPWLVTVKNPIIDVRMLATRQFGSCFIATLGIGAILIATTQFVPQILQTNYGYTATWAGLALSPGGLVTMGMMVVTGALVGKVQPKYLIAAGAAVIAYSMWFLTSLTPDANFGFFVESRFYLGIGLPLIFIPITAASYDGLRPDQTDQASALINAARNTGGSIGVCIATNVLDYREQWHQSRLIENFVPSRQAFQQADQVVQGYFLQHGASALDAQNQAIGWLGSQVQVQASFLAYIDVFYVLALISVAIIPLALILRNIDVPSGHHSELE